MYSLHCAPAPAQNKLQNPPNTVDRLLQVEGAAALVRGAQLDNVQPKADGSGVELAAGAAAGSITLAPVKTEFAFNELLPSWNGWAGNGSGFRVLLSAYSSNGRGTPTPWIEAGTWGAVPEDASNSRVVQFDGGVYDIDTLLLQQPLDVLAVRIDLFRKSPSSQSPMFGLLSLAYTNSTGDNKLGRQFGGAGRRGAGARYIDVPTTLSVNAPYHSQMLPRDKGKPKKDQWVGRVCSPCAVNGALGAFLVRMATEDLAAELYDPKSDAFGVWHRSIQGAAQHGVRGYIRRFRNWTDVQQQLAQGAVIVASIRFEPGEVRDPLAVVGKRQEGTKGHLVMIKGLAPGRVAIVHDSASKDYGPNSLWAQEDLAKAWFDKGGVAYVFTGRNRR